VAAVVVVDGVLLPVVVVVVAAVVVVDGVLLPVVVVVDVVDASNGVGSSGS
jgi:hypothetical protein